MKYVQLFQPVIIFALTWLSVILLLSLRLSTLLEESLADAWFFYLISLGPFFAGYCIALLFQKKLQLVVKAPVSITDRYYSKFNKFLIFWVIMTLVEIAYSGGFPFIWLLTGSEKTYFDFGIPSIHGFLNALQLALSIISFFFYKISKKKKYLYITILFFIWNILIITRQVIVVLLIEVFVINFFLSKNKIKLMKSLVVSGLLFVIGFGVLGDFRSGAEGFIILAQPTENWPLWLPSGFLWVYIYITTPLNNLLFNFHFPITTPHYFFPSTLSLFLPSVLRNLIFDPEMLGSGNLVTQAFNVSSAFVAPYIDMGKYGIVIFSFYIGVFCNFTWWAEGSKQIFFRAITTQIIILSIFYNMFMYLPVVFQFVWIFIYFLRFKKHDTQ